MPGVVPGAVPVAVPGIVKKKPADFRPLCPPSISPALVPRTVFRFIFIFVCGRVCGALYVRDAVRCRAGLPTHALLLARKARGCAIQACMRVVRLSCSMLVKVLLLVGSCFVLCLFLWGGSRCYRVEIGRVSEK